MKKIEYLSVRAYARRLNVDPKAVRKAIAEGKIRSGYDAQSKKIRPDIADKEWGFQHKLPKVQRGVSALKVAEKLNAGQPPADSGRKGTANEPGAHLGQDQSYEQLTKNIAVTADMSYDEALKANQLLNTAITKIELEELNGQLVRKSDVDKQLFALGNVLKKALLNIPARCIAEVRAAATDIEGSVIMTREIEAVLKQVADLEYKN